MKLDTRHWVILAVGMSLASAGCGSKPPAAAPAAPVANAPTPPPAPVQAANTGTATAPPEVAKSEEESEPVLPGPDDFEISSDEIVMEVDSEFQEPPPVPVDVVALAPGLDSTTLEIADPNGADPTAAATNSPNIPELAKPPVNELATKTANKAVSRAGNATTKGKTEEKEAPPPTAAGWQLPAAATEVAGSGTDPETGLPLKITVGRDPVEMVLVPPGVFLEGIDGREPQAAPQHPVLLETPYYIDVVEVTVARHDAFREFLRKSEGRRIDGAANHDGNPENPAVGIKFLDAKFYAKWTGKELPTEAQWERAARGSQGFNFPWGNGRPIWPQPRQPGQLDPVATFSGDVSPYGVYDMAGNAREWCLDLYSPETYRNDVAAGASTVRNPAGPKTIPGGAKLQVVRGSKTDWAVWHRSGLSQAEVAPDLGFRCVLNVAAAGSDGDKSKKGSEKKKKTEAF